MFSRMYNPGGFRRCAVCSPGPGLGMIPESARTSLASLRSVLAARAHAAATATAGRWPAAEASLVEALEYGRTVYRRGRPAGSSATVWQSFLDTLGNAAWTLTSQRQDRAAGSGGTSTMIWEEEVGGPPSPVTGVGARPPSPGPAPSGKPGMTPSAPGAPTPPVRQAGIMQSLQSPWLLAGVLGVGAVAAVWYATSYESPPKRKK